MRKDLIMMRAMAALLVLGLPACGEAGESPEAGEIAEAGGTPMAAAPAPQSSVAGTPAATKAGLLAIPQDKAEMQRLVDLGYTPHDDHLHPPGAKECPLMGGDMVQ